MPQARQRKLLLPMSGQNIELDETNQNSSSRDSISLTSISSKHKNSIHEIPTYFAFLIITILCMLFGGVYLLDKSLPGALKISDEKNYPSEFIAERAQRILKGLTDIGPKVVGSKENEVEAVEYLNNAIDQIISEAHDSFTITKDNQVTSGSYYLGFTPNGLINSYANVQNIVVKINGRNASSDSILINAHFDSVPTSPGASDDGIMIAVMLETLRKLTTTQHEYEKNIIFLLNGAEETPLQAAHGFITQHEWAKSCKTIINLEAAGHGGRAILFQSGPKRSPSLMSHYLTVPYPYGMAAGEEIFQSNLIPSDTDFRLFRDYGGLSGFDMAFAQNGYRYHTKYDNFEDLPLGSYQHAGSNLLALVRSLANDSNDIEESDEKVVYFDVFNWFMISYSMLAAYIVNIGVALLSVVVAILSARNLQLGVNKSSFLYLLYATLTILGSWVLAAGVALLLALLIDATTNTMTWYGSPIIIFGLYVAPIVGCFTLVLWFWNYFGPHGGKSLGTQSQIQMHINRLIWTFVLFIGTLVKLRSVYVILIPVLFNTMASIVVLLLKWQHTARKWQICVFAFTLLSTIFSMYMGVEIYSLFIPITGRIGANRNPELIISLLTVLVLLLIGSHYISFSVLVKRQYMIPIILFLGCLVTFIVIVSHGAFPYSADKTAPTPQRFSVYHTNRIHHDINGETSEQSGIFLLNMDRNSPNSVKDDIGLIDYRISTDCEKYPACGMPISSARMLATVEASSWMPFQKAIINEEISMNYTTKQLGKNLKQYSFVVEGPDHLTGFIEPLKGTKIMKTSLYDIETDELIFINHVYGKIKTNLEFTVDVQAENVENPLMDFVVSGKYFNFNGKEQMTEEFNDFIKKFPEWADVVPALANYESYVI